MSRRVYLLGVVIALLALGLAFTELALSFQAGVTEANVRRIRAGMTLTEVEAILGGPGELWTTTFDTTIDQHNVVITRDRLWSQRGGPMKAYVWFDRSDLVVKAELALDRFAPAKPSLLTRLRAWLGW